MKTGTVSSNCLFICETREEYYMLSLGERQSILMKNESGYFNVASFEKEIKKIEKYAKMPVVLWLDTISSYQRNALIKNRISFIVPNSQIFVPEFGMSLREFCMRSRNRREKRQNSSNDPVFASLFYLSKEEGRKEPIGDCKMS